MERKEFQRIKELLSPDLHFEGPSGAHSTATAFISSLKRLTAIHVRSDIMRVFADGDEACVIYDFVTDTRAGALVQDTLLRVWRARESYAADGCHRVSVRSCC